MRKVKSTRSQMRKLVGWIYKVNSNIRLKALGEVLLHGRNGVPGGDTGKVIIRML